MGAGDRGSALLSRLTNSGPKVNVISELIVFTHPMRLHLTLNGCTCFCRLGHFICCCAMTTKRLVVTVSTVTQVYQIHTKSYSAPPVNFDLRSCKDLDFFFELYGCKIMYCAMYINLNVKNWREAFIMSRLTPAC